MWQKRLEHRIFDNLISILLEVWVGSANKQKLKWHFRKATTKSINLPNLTAILKMSLLFLISNSNIIQRFCYFYKSRKYWTRFSFWRKGNNSRDLAESGINTISGKRWIIVYCCLCLKIPKNTGKMSGPNMHYWNITGIIMQIIMHVMSRG